jgi:hypothetical protein
LNQILKRQTSRFHYGSKFPAVTITVVITILKQNRQNSCQNSTKLSEINVKDTLTSHIDKKIVLTFLLTPYLYTFSLYENPSFIIFSAETGYISTRSWEWWWMYMNGTCTWIYGLLVLKFFCLFICLMETQCYMRWVSYFEPLVFVVIKSHPSIATFYLHDLLLGDLFLPWTYLKIIAPLMLNNLQTIFI